MIETEEKVSKLTKLWNEDIDKDNLDDSIGVLQRLLWLSVPGDLTKPLKSDKEQFDLMAKVNAHLAATIQIGTFVKMMISTAITDDKRHTILDDLCRCCLGQHEWKGAEGNGAKTRGDLAKPPPPPPDEPKTIVPPVPPPYPRILSVPALLRDWIPKSEATVLRSSLQGEEKKFFSDMLKGWCSKIMEMPVTYETEDIPEDLKVVHLHYFTSSWDWYVVEKDKSANEPEEGYPSGRGQIQAFGVVDGHEREMGYINIPEIVANGGELDLYWKAKTIGEIYPKTDGEDIWMPKDEEIPDAEAEEQAMDEELSPYTTAAEAADDPYIKGQMDDIEEVINPLKTKDGTPMDQAAKQAAEDSRHHYPKAVELHQIRELLNEFMTEQAARDKKLLDMVEGEITLARGEALRSAEATQQLIKDMKFVVTTQGRKDNED